MRGETQNFQEDATATGEFDRAPWREIAFYYHRFRTTSGTTDLGAQHLAHFRKLARGAVALSIESRTGASAEHSDLISQIVESLLLKDPDGSSGIDRIMDLCERPRAGVEQDEHDVEPAPSKKRRLIRLVGIVSAIALADEERRDIEPLWRDFLIEYVGAGRSPVPGPAARAVVRGLASQAITRLVREVVVGRDRDTPPFSTPSDRLPLTSETLTEWVCDERLFPIAGQRRRLIDAVVDHAFSSDTDLDDAWVRFRFGSADGNRGLPLRKLVRQSCWRHDVFRFADSHAGSVWSAATKSTAYVERNPTSPEVRPRTWRSSSEPRLAPTGATIAMTAGGLKAECALGMALATHACDLPGERCLRRQRTPAEHTLSVVFARGAPDFAPSRPELRRIILRAALLVGRRTEGPS